MEHGAVDEAPRAVWLGRMAAVMEARGDRDEAVRLFGEAVTELTGDREATNRCLDAGAGITVGCHGKVGGGGDKECSSRGIASGSQLFSRTSMGSGTGDQEGMGDLFPYSARAHLLASIIERSYRRHFLR